MKKNANVILLCLAITALLIYGGVKRYQALHPKDLMPSFSN